jgi:putative transposase
MRRAGIYGLAALRRRTRTTDSRHDYPIAPNRLARNFTAQAPNQIWLADLTYIPTGEGWLYLAAILDVYTSKIVGWSMRDTLHTEIALDALTMALERQHPVAGLLHHSDRGIQYAAEAYRQSLAAANIVPSMSRKGNCWDTQSNILLERRLDLTRAGIGQAAFALTRRSCCRSEHCRAQPQ